MDNYMENDNQDYMIDSIFERFEFITDKLVQGKWKIVKTDDPNLKLELNKWYGYNEKIGLMDEIK